MGQYVILTKTVVTSIMACFECSSFELSLSQYLTQVWQHRFFSCGNADEEILTLNLVFFK